MAESWTQVMALKNKETRTKGVANTLKDDEIETIFGTMDFFGASDNFMRQSMFDLRACRYRLFDWIAMCLDGRRECKDGNNILPVQVITFSYLKSGGNIDAFISDLRETDYQIDMSYQVVVMNDQ